MDESIDIFEALQDISSTARSENWWITKNEDRHDQDWRSREVFIHREHDGDEVYARGDLEITGSMDKIESPQPGPSGLSFRTPPKSDSQNNLYHYSDTSSSSSSSTDIFERPDLFRTTGWLPQNPFDVPSSHEEAISLNVLLRTFEQKIQKIPFPQTKILKNLL
ncbi:hypothetical protein L596_006269 [Steinernema carpocapsae]|uniref:Uncharacterized protein n=1 Tax=Steinernema carpocapsae TaxID=34508 RepID=A0A4V6I8Y9_STECR|nr:hypothetical protein L596_006269 [Steinernema carpocapsae]